MRPAYLLDVTRSLRRAGRQPTGVDRVERAYLDHLLANPAPLFGLARTRLGYVLSDRAGLRDFRDRLRADDWPAPDLLSRMSRDPRLARAETALRRRAIARCAPMGLRRMLRRHVPRGASYVNTGHSNLTPRVQAAVRDAGLRCSVFVHDTIPLDHPQHQRPGTVAPFRAFLDRAATADAIVANSRQTLDDIDRHATTAADRVAAPLGVQVPRINGTARAPWPRPYVIALGTIEPRKNHAFLLDLWRDNPDLPDLLIVGARGWNNDAVFARLDARPDRVHELGALPDADTFALLQGAQALLFPSLAEGFGLPPFEAAALGVPVLANTLPLYREYLGDAAVYLDVADPYLWTKTIRGLNPGDSPSRHAAPRRWTPPTWDDHFLAVMAHL